MTQTLIPQTSTQNRRGEAELARRIEAGVLAEAVRTGGVRIASDATDLELALLVSDGQRAHDELVAENQRLVWLVVNPVAARTGLSRDELYQEGCLGLLEAVQRFEPATGCFATFALHWIRLRVHDAAATRFGALGLPAKRARQWWRVQGLCVRLKNAPGEGLEVARIADELQLPVTTVADLLAWRAAAHLQADDDVVPAGPAVVQDERVTELLSLVDGVERLILQCRFGLGEAPPQSYAGVAEVVGLSEATVRRRERAALERLRHVA